MALLKDIAQVIMDLYYQNYKADEDFFTKNHFKYLAGVAYNDFLQEYYELNYKKHLAEQGKGDVEFDGSWFVSTEIELTKEGDQFVGVFKQKPIAFLYDNQHRSIQLIEPTGCDVKLVRLSSVELWKIRSKTFPVSSFSFWYLLGDKIKIAKVPCGLEKITVHYLPAVTNIDDSTIIADGLQKKIIDATLNLMAIARQGGVVNMTNNQNTNKVLETEIGNIYRDLKTK